jgi:hypothetical protein
LSAHIPQLSGDEWQNWANKLLTCHYGPTNYQKVPDNDKGDAGIEGFTISDGHAYQAYGCEGEPLKMADRYEKQRNKMTEDIGKFINNSTILTKIFGHVKITRWALFVPHYDSKEIVVHAARKTSEVIRSNLSYVSNDDFRVVICDEEDFYTARNKIINSSTQAIKIIKENATQEDLEKWEISNNGLVAALEEKLLKLPTIKSMEQRRKFHEDVLKWHLEGQAVLDALRQYPEVYEKVISAKSHQESYLSMSAAIGATPQQILQSSLSELLDTLKQEVKELHLFSARDLAYEAVSDWLLRCPLDFPELP